MLGFTSSHLLRGSDLNPRCDRRRAIPELVQSEVRLVDEVNVRHCLSFSQPSHYLIVRIAGQFRISQPVTLGWQRHGVAIYEWIFRSHP
jgi:hypothetical protein